MNTHTSVSRMTSLARCGLAYELERVQGHTPIPAGWAIQGLAIHAALEAYEKSRRQMPAGEVQEVFRHHWQNLLSEADATGFPREKWLAGGRKSPEQDLADRYEDGQRQVADYIRYCQEDDRLRPYETPDGEPAAEVGFEVEFAGVTVRGYIDLILQDVETGTLLLRDIKSGSKPPVVPLQLIVYRMAVAEIFGEDVVWGDFFMTRDGRPTPPIDLTRLDQDLIATWFKRSTALVERGLYIPNPGESTCRTCGVSYCCPLLS